MIPSPTTTLLTGPYDWDEAEVPRTEYAARLAALREAAAPDTLLLQGNSQEFGALAWATGFVPKLGPAICVIPQSDEPTILFSGGGGMVASAQLLTWVDQVRAITGLNRDLAGLLEGQTRVAQGRIALGGGACMAAQVRAAIGPDIVDLDPAINALRRRKSPLEQQLLRRAAELLDPAIEALRAALAAGQGMRAAGLAAEARAYALGAQDVRVLASRRPFGPALALDDVADQRIEQPLVAIAVRRALYWAVARLALGENPAIPAARDALDAAIARLRPGAPVEGARGIGLSWREAPVAGILAEGDAVLLRGVGEVGVARAEVSAMCLVTETGADIIWAGEAA